MQVLMNVTGCNAFASARFGSHDETITTSTFMIDAAKIHSFLFHNYAICDNCVDSGNKVGENYILCLILKFEEIFPKNRKLSPKDKIISPKDKMISPKEIFLLIIYPAQIAADDFLLHAEQNFGCDFLEVKVKGVFLIFILYSLF